MRLRHKLKTGGLILVWLALLSLTGCDSAAHTSSNTPTSPTTAMPNMTVVLGPTPTFLVPTAALPTAALPTPTSEQSDKVLQALVNLANSTTLTYTVQQIGDLKTSATMTHFEASGKGEWQRPAYHQLLTFSEGSITQQLETYSDGTHAYQRTVGLVIWKPVTPLVKTPFPNTTRLNGASNFQDLESQSFNGQTVSVYSWQFPSNQILPATGAPESLGVLSVTGLYQAFANDKSTSHANIWVNSAGQILRYELAGALVSGDNTLDYTYTYDFSNFNGSVTIQTPTDLPK